MADLNRISLGLREKPALILVDLINGFTDPPCPLGTESNDVITANQHLLATFRELTLPIVYTTVVFHASQQAKVFDMHAKYADLLSLEETLCLLSALG